MFNKNFEVTNDYNNVKEGAFITNKSVENTIKIKPKFVKDQPDGNTTILTISE